jgi:CHRD domain-containing protein
MLRSKLLQTSLVAVAVTFAGSGGYADDSSARSDEFTARLNGFNELGALNNQTGAVLSNGTGTVTLHLHQTSIDYTLSYSDVGTTGPKTGTVSQAHIHFGKSRDSGGVIVFFCGTTATPGPAGTPTCPPHTGTVTGTWTAASVVGPASQNIAPGNFDGLVAALTSNTAYANIHTTSSPTPPAPDTAFPAGEIRGQCHSEDREHQENR